MPTPETYIAEREAGVSKSHVLCRSPRGPSGFYETVMLPRVGYFRSWLTLGLGECVWNNTSHACYVDSGHELAPHGVYVVWLLGGVQRIGTCDPYGSARQDWKSPESILGEHKRERARIIADNKLNRRWAPSRKLYDGPERIFEE